MRRVGSYSRFARVETPRRAGGARSIRISDCGESGRPGGWEGRHYRPGSREAERRSQRWARLVIEEFLEGEEVSFIVLSDGRNVVSEASRSQGSRRRRHRPNTGGWALTAMPYSLG